MTLASLGEVLTFLFAWLAFYLVAELRADLTEALRQSLAAWARWMRTMVRPKEDPMFFEPTRTPR